MRLRPALSLKYQPCVVGEVDSPVAPDVSALALDIGVGQLPSVEHLAEAHILLVEEVRGTYGYPVELHALVELAYYLALHVAVYGRCLLVATEYRRRE